LFWKYGYCYDGANAADLDDGDYVYQKMAARYLQSPVPEIHMIITACNVTAPLKHACKEDHPYKPQNAHWQHFYD